MFTEANSVEDFVRALLCGARAGELPLAVLEEVGVAGRLEGLGWDFVEGVHLPRADSDVLVEDHVRQALVKLNPEIAEKPDRADEVMYKLRAILLSVGSEGLVRANETFTSWLRGECSMPFGPNNQHVPVRLIDFENIKNNRFVCATQVTFRAGPERRFDLVLYVNGIPLVVGEAKTPVRPSESWFDGAKQFHDDYEVSVSAFFAANVLNFATEGKTFRFGSIRMPIETWAPWREPDKRELSGLAAVEQAVRGLLRPEVILDILQFFTVFATDKKHRKVKIICRYQQYQAANQIVERVVAGRVKKGLIWHFQGSGKSLLMVFAALKLRMHEGLHNPTVIIVVDRIDLDTQITATFNAADVPNMVPVEKRAELERLLAQDVRKVIITTIYKFGEAEGVLNARDNIIVLVDEAHRTQEGDLGRKMRRALPNAFLFGLTGTPINRRDRNTFWAFGADEDEKGYLSRYSFEESIRDEATLPLHFEARMAQMHVDQQAIDDASAAMAEEAGLSESDRAELNKRAAKLGVLLKSPERVQAVVADIVQHFHDNVEPNGFKVLVVTFDRAACVQYKAELDKLLPPEATEVVMSVGTGDHADWRQRFGRSKEDEERLLDRFRDPADPLQMLVVTAKLLAGFDAPVLQVMYFDKPMKDHALVQAICRTNRPFTGKSHGLVVDYIGVFDDAARALDFDEKSVQRVITSLDELRKELPLRVAKCLAYFPNVDRKVSGYEGLIAAQECLPDNDTRDAFAADFSYLAKLWEALSPDRCLQPYTDDYRWLSQVYESVKPVSDIGRLLWRTFGAKTIQLIHDNIHVESAPKELDKLVLDADMIAKLTNEQERKHKAKEIIIRISERLRRHPTNPTFIDLGRRLEELKQRHEQGLLTSIEFLKQLLDLARDVVKAEKATGPEEMERQGKAALTQLFEEARNKKTPIIVERVVADIDEIVRQVRFPGWQQTIAGEREVKKALRSTLLKYRLHHDQDLFDRAYGYIRQYY
jgi:type I restriction enzyme R subunit